MSYEKIKSFRDLSSWQEAHKLVIMIYNITKNFPKQEMFGIISQMRRAAVSISSNIAEGFSRQTYKDKVQFYFMGQGSLTELQNQLLIAKDLRYLKEKDYNETINQSIKVQKLINGLIKASRKRIQK